jgi:hypothetical protein
MGCGLCGSVGWLEQPQHKNNNKMLKPTKNRKQASGASHYGLAIYIKKYCKAKEELWRTQIFHHAKNIIFKKFL